MVALDFKKKTAKLCLRADQVLKELAEDEAINMKDDPGNRFAHMFLNQCRTV